MAEEPASQGPIAWMCRNRVAANLLMLIFLIGGLVVSFQVKQEVFPEFTLDLITITVPYPGASPEEVERGIVLVIEDEVRGLDGVKTVTSRAREGEASIVVELTLGADANKALQDIKNAVDRIQSIPQEAEKPIVSLIEARTGVISLIIYGNQEHFVLRKLAEEVRDDLLLKEGITLVELESVSPLQINIEVPRKELRRYGLTLDQIAERIRETALELPGGGVKTSGGEVLLRTKERRDFASEFATIPIVINPDGSKRQLDEIASVQEGVADSDEGAFFQGKPAVRIDVFRVGSQTPLAISDQVRKCAEEISRTLPEGIAIATWDDKAEIFRDRIDLLLRNAGIGLFLVLLLLALFLDPRLAFWVALGIPISIVGSFLFIPFTAASINMISLFAFIVTVGIIVDDAVVVGENIYQKWEEGVPPLRAAIEGAKEISTPVVFAVLTNIAAFLPLLFVPGSTGKLFLQIPSIVIAVFIVSLVESLFILPAHLSQKKKDHWIWQQLAKPSAWFEKKLGSYIEQVYTPFLRKALEYRYFTLTVALGFFLLSIGFVGGGYVQFSYLPRVDSDLVTAQAILPFGVPLSEAHDLQTLLVERAEQVVKKEGGNISRGIYTQIGSPLSGGGPTASTKDKGKGTHLVGAQLLLVPSDQREISGIDFANKWRAAVGDVVGVDSLSFSATIGATGGAAIDIELSHKSTDVIEQAARELAHSLKNYSGVEDIDSGVTLGKSQMNFRLTQEARALGLTARNLARQVRWAFYGSEALRQQRGRDELKVMVRLPEEERETIFTVEQLILQTPEGGEIPLADAADTTLGRAYSIIKRVDGRRVISVRADVDESHANANEIIADVENRILPPLLEKYPGLTYSLEGQQREQKESLDSLKMGFLLALIAIYALLATPFKSYLQPVIVMSSIPFGVIGALLGHLLLGYELSIISMFGIIALSGVVVNDALVFVVTANRKRRKENASPTEALVFSGAHRFRPILLTSLTTFLGLAPMIFETSMQARFLIPMAVSLGFGVLFATFITLLLTPALYLIIEDVKGLISSHS